MPHQPVNGIPHWLSRLRSYFFWDPLIWFYTGFLGSLSLLSSFFDRDGEIQHSFARLWSRAILGTIGTSVRVEGLEKVDTSRPHVYVVNHLSALDIPVIYAQLPFQFRILAKRELFRYPFMGWHLSRSGQIPVNTENVRMSLRGLHRGIDALKKNMPIVVFPEGGRSKSGHLMEFMGGAFFLAIKAQVDVVPMALVGTYETLPMSTWHIKPHPLHLIVGDPISTAGMTIRDMDALSNKARNVIADLYYARSPLPDMRKEICAKS
ncbi:MAG TPA: lysophospholipid acyltransferase family protein [Candidatus Angelobacter sp.]|jgi:1-acyl-sn-glycerol-3-phosphate acyltransferase|nr:lysophospholipid acyltransferase family protein [Candidatus Angelobacter sp.]